LVVWIHPRNYFKMQSDLEIMGPIHRHLSFVGHDTEHMTNL